MQNLALSTGGKLFGMGYSRDRLGTAELSVDLTDKAPELVLETCAVGEGVTVKDAYLLLKHHSDAFANLFGEDVSSIVEEGMEPFSGDTSRRTSPFSRAFVAALT